MPQTGTYGLSTGIWAGLPISSFPAYIELTSQDQTGSAALFLNQCLLPVGLKSRWRQWGHGSKLHPTFCAEQNSTPRRSPGLKDKPHWACSASSPVEFVCSLQSRKVLPLKGSGDSRLAHIERPLLRSARGVCRFDPRLPPLKFDVLGTLWTISL